MFASVQKQQPCSTDNLHNRFLLTLLNAQRRGQSSLPFNLGLSAAELENLLQHCELADPQKTLSKNTAANIHAVEQGNLRQELLTLRDDEFQDLVNLLTAHRAHQHPLELAFAKITAAGCLGSGHLWQDMGFENRSQLSEFLWLNFPSLSHKNTKNMKWKKFFYKQLCEQHGSYVCRAPSCEECRTYDDCFGEE